MKQYFKIFDEPWDVLIILDACRFDYFEKSYSDFLKGKLHKKVTCGTNTPEWRNNNFKDYYKDIVYISSNPYINGKSEVEGFDSKKHFVKVYDVWETHWDSKLGTVTPESVSDVTLQAVKENPDKKLIVHYLQPHAPYLALDAAYGFSEPKNNFNPFRFSNEPDKPSIRTRLLNYFIKHNRKFNFFSNHTEWYIAQLLKLPAQSPMDYARRNYGIKGLRDAYTKNLNLVLNEVAYLISNLDAKRKIIISADHGELLGEKNWFSHPHNSNNPIVRNVPWFEVEEVVKHNIKRKDSVQNELADQIDIANKLKDLGYM